MPFGKGAECAFKFRSSDREDPGENGYCQREGPVLMLILTLENLQTMQNLCQNACISSQHTYGKDEPSDPTTITWTPRGAKPINTILQYPEEVEPSALLLSSAPTRPETRTMLYVYFARL